jgi:hypothetical protein
VGSVGERRPAAKTVDTDNHNCVTKPGVVEKRGKAAPLLPGGRSRQLVPVDAARVDTSCRQRVELLVQGLMPGFSRHIVAPSLQRCPSGP